MLISPSSAYPAALRSLYKISQQPVIKMKNSTAVASSRNKMVSDVGQLCVPSDNS
jgi:hypothetical protein